MRTGLRASLGAFGVGLALMGLSGAAVASTAGTAKSAAFSSGGSVNGARQLTAAPLQKVVLKISAYVDGRSVLTVSGNKARWHHLTQAAPGLGDVYPMKIGSASWMPKWPAAGQNRDCGCNSDVFKGVDPALPATGPITFTAVSCREKCSATAGGGKAVITFDDDVSPGFVLYVVKLTYFAKVKPTVAVTVSAGGDLKNVGAGDVVPLTVKITAGPTALTAVGLRLEPKGKTAAAVTITPNTRTGLSLSARKTRSFTFRAKSNKAGKVEIKVSVTGKTSTGNVGASAGTSFSVKPKM